jgi:eukaryotic-like serine/threonine-protein kinase
MDYLETRADVDHSRLAFYGVSLGALWGPIFLAIEPRFRTAILVVGGLPRTPSAPEVDPIHFAPRVRMPVLMLNGRYDFGFPLQSSQVPLFRLLGTPEKDKRHVVFESAHDVPRNGLIREVLEWLDQRMGAVSARP